MALGFIALSRAIGNDSIERVCRKLLYTTLEFIDDQLILNKNIDDIDITVSWKLYKHYRTMSYRETKDGWLGEFAIVIFPFIFSDERVFAENGGSYELGRGIVETAVQLAPVAKRFGKMFGVDMS